jgi:hypothetical protein
MLYDNQATIQQQAMNQPMNQPKQQPLLMILGERFEKSLSQLQTMNARLQDITSRALGSVPPTADSSKNLQNPAVTSVGQLEQHQKALDGMLSQLHEIISRLDSL